MKIILHKDNTIHKLLYHTKWSHIRNTFITDMVNEGKITRGYYNICKAILEQKYEKEQKIRQIKKIKLKSC